MASSWNLNAYAPINTSRIRILNMLAIINVLEKWLNFFSLALNSKVTRVKVIPAKRSNRNGQNRVIIPEVENVTTKPKTARAAVKIIR